MESAWSEYANHLRTDDGRALADEIRKRIDVSLQSDKELLRLSDEGSTSHPLRGRAAPDLPSRRRATPDGAVADTPARPRPGPTRARVGVSGLIRLAHLHRFARRGYADPDRLDLHHLAERPQPLGGCLGCRLRRVPYRAPPLADTAVVE